MMSVQQHNRTVLLQLRLGDLVEFDRDFYSHWGVYVGDEDIVHLAGDDNDGLNGMIRPEHSFSIGGVAFSKARVRRENFFRVAGNTKANINNKRDKSMSALNPGKVVQNALNRVGEVGYNLMYKNCEHFAKWCRYGVPISDQVDNAMTGVAIIGAAALTYGVIRAFAGLFSNKDEEEEQKQ